MSTTAAYRSDIDCFRFLAVLAVIFFHCALPFSEGGFLGVDIFFVISGYVMYASVSRKSHFGWRDIPHFFKKRILRIYPALLITLLLTACASALIMDVVAFDYFGKQLFFAALSLSNLLFAKGHNYFDSDTPILLHTWSLAVEMQFYFIFPFFMIALTILKTRTKSAATFLLLILIGTTGLYAANTSEANSSFFLLQNRAFEFLLGMLAAHLPRINFTSKARSAIITSCLAAIVIQFMFLTAGDWHPGMLTLAAVLPAAIILKLGESIRIPQNATVNITAYLGRLSYGIYLFHFPITVITEQTLSQNPIILLTANIFITLPLAALSYRFFETPIRNIGYKKSFFAYINSAAIIAVAIGISGAGYLIAKHQGVPQRLQLFNTYAFEVSKLHTQSKSNFVRGYHIQPDQRGEILFIGDSLLQQYIDPISNALGIPKEKVDSVTRGGCVLLKGVDFEDVYADISCDDLREKLYNSQHTYKYIVISQYWGKYKNAVHNAPKRALESQSPHDYMIPFLEGTIDHFRNPKTQIIVLGVHPTIKIEHKIKIGPTLSATEYTAFLNSLRAAEQPYENHKKAFQGIQQSNVRILHSIDLFCNMNAQNCALKRDGKSFFDDYRHLTKAGQEHAEEQLKALFDRP